MSNDPAISLRFMVKPTFNKSRLLEVHTASSSATSLRGAVTRLGLVTASALSPVTFLPLLCLFRVCFFL